MEKKITSEDTLVPAHILDVNDNVEPRSLPVVLSFSHLKYIVTNAKKFNFTTLFDPISTSTTTILNDISGETRDGEIMAILGASGSGKSTLIDAVANRMANGNLQGSITLNGDHLEPRLLKAISAYVMQDDLLFPMLTVEETLMFAAEARLPRSVSKSKKKSRVKALIDQLGLRDVTNTVIGDEGHRGVSGGERRRVSIGVEIIHNPLLLFLDEPTSGLDSTSAFMVVKVLQRIAKSGSVVIMSVHQPSYRIMGLINSIIFLSRGETVYSGPPSNLALFFSNFGCPVPDNENEVEFALDLIREMEGSPDGTEALLEFHKSWQTKKNTTNCEPRPVLNDLTLEEAIISRRKLVSAGSNIGDRRVPKFANPLWAELFILSKRSFTNLSRTPKILVVRMASVIVTGLVLGTVFWKLDHSPKGVQDRLGFYAFGISTLFFCSCDNLGIFLQERYIFMRETAYNTYRRSSYAISHALVSIPMLLLMSLGFAVTTFWTVGLNGSFLFYFMVIFASFWSGSSFVIFVTGLLPDLTLGLTIVVGMLAYFVIFCGFVINRDRIPRGWIWFHYLSLVKYPYEAVLRNEFDDATKCFVRAIQLFDGTSLAGLSDALKVKLLEGMGSTLDVNMTSTTCIITGTDVLQKQGVTQFSKWTCLVVVVACGFFFRILFYLTLLKGSKNKR